MSGFTYEEQFIVIHCDCGVSYAVTQSFDNQRRQDHKTFRCLNGCSRWYPHENEIERANRLAREANKKIESLNNCIDHKKNIIKRRDFQMRYYKGQVTKLKKKNG